MSIWTNWDPLEEVIVGNCHAPGEFDNFIDTDIRNDFNKILKETKEDLDGLATTLQSMGVVVHRPTLISYRDKINLGTFDITMPMSPVVPRDQYLAYGDTIYQTYTSMPNRYLDPRSYYDTFRTLYDQGYNWISQPPPNLVNVEAIEDWWKDGGKIYQVLDNQLLWHTATMIKCGDAIVANTGGPGNPRGLEWMKRNLPEGTRIIPNHGTSYNNWGHIDHAFFVVNDDTVVCIDRTFVPECLRNKNLIEFGKYLKDPRERAGRIDELKETPADSIHRLKKYIAEWSGYDQDVYFDTNVLVVDPHNIIVSTIPPIMIKILERNGINVHVCHQRHGLFWESGIHCATLDLKRRGERRRIID